MLGAPWCGMRMHWQRGLGLTLLEDKERVESRELLVVAQEGWVQGTVSRSRLGLVPLESTGVKMNALITT